jgi:hypothetical protein
VSEDVWSIFLLLAVVKRTNHVLTLAYVSFVDIDLSRDFTDVARKKDE